MSNRRLPLSISKVGFRFLAGAVVAVSALGGAQTWEKFIAPGLTYRSEVDTTIPRMLHALRWTPRSQVIQAVPELAGGTVYEDNASKGRESVSGMAQRTGAIAAINADFFPFTGDPLGMMVRNRELVSLPYPNRSAFGWGPKTTATAVPVPDLTFVSEGAAPISLTQFNEECKANSISLSTERAGIARSSSASCIHAVLKVNEGNWQVGGKVVAEVQFLSSDTATLPVAPGNCVLTATGTMMPFLAGFRPGQHVEFRLNVAGFDWAKIDNVVGGGPTLVKEGAIAVDAPGQGFDATFSDKRHPRSAVGRTKDGDLWWVAIDGRQKLSDGATLDELARVMQRLGCVDAINLDGGGSTALSILGLVVNRPSEGKEREVANGVVFLGPAPVKEEAALAISAPPQIAAGTTSYLRVLGAGAPIPNAEVVWSASGSGWIDQGGFLRATAEGTVFVSAWVRGQVVAAGLTVTPAPPPPPKGSGVQSPSP